jgi:hypothetical protein
MKGCGSRKRDLNKNDTKHGWRAISFKKKIHYNPRIKNNVDYTTLTPQYFSNSILIQNFIFVIFSPC